MADTESQSTGQPGILVRPANERGHFDFGWLDTYHSFSFGDYHDPEWMGFRSLRVINDDRIGPGGGFPSHPHRDMEIITYMLSGALSHRDSLGNGATIRPGWVQYMCAGTGVMHSEYNAQDGETRLLQIWIKPPRGGLPPSYDEAAIPQAAEGGGLHLIAGPRGAPITTHQDTALYATVIEAGQAAAHTLGPGRYGWLQVARGALTLNGVQLAEGDGAAISPAEGAADIASALSISSDSGTEFLLFDLA